MTTVTTKQEKVLKFTEKDMIIIKMALEGMVHEAENDEILQSYKAPVEKLLNELYNLD